MTKTKLLKLAMAYYATAQLEIELNDSLKSTSIYRNELKAALKNVIKETKKSVEKIYKELNNEDAELQLQKVVKMVELFVKIIEDKDFDVSIGLLEEYHSGQIAIVDEKKHKKIFHQLDKI